VSTHRRKTTDEDRIRAIVGDWAQAVRAQDIDGILANHAPASIGPNRSRSCFSRTSIV